MLEERPPTEDEVSLALKAFAQSVRAKYGTRVKKILLFGSRARGDHRPDSDADVAVVLEDGDWSFWREKMVLGGLAYDQIMDLGVVIQSWPIAASEWFEPERHRNPAFVRDIRREAQSIEARA